MNEREFTIQNLNAGDVLCAKHEMCVWIFDETKTGKPTVTATGFGVPMRVEKNDVCIVLGKEKNFYYLSYPYTRTVLLARGAVVSYIKYEFDNVLSGHWTFL